jgi:hypothetical protein
VKKVEDKNGMTVFVKIDEYKDIMDLVNLMRSKIQQARYVLNRIAELKRQEDDELEAWSSELDNVEERIDVIDKRLTEPEI